jgi:hypothetical protein
MNATAIKIPAGTLAPLTNYYFTLTFSKGVRSSAATAVVQTTALQIPVVSIQPLVPAVVNRNSRVVLRGSASLSDSTFDPSRPQPIFKYQWGASYEDGSNMDNVALVEVASRSEGQTVMVIDPNVLDTGKSYIIQLVVINIGDGSSSFSQVQFSVNVPPTAGEVSVLPESGSIMDTFTVSCLQFVSNALPLTYSFGYYDATETKMIPLISNPTTSNSLSTQLPIGNGANNTLKLYVQVYDKYNAYITVNASAAVSTPQQFNVFDWIKNKTQSSLQTSLASNDAEQVTQIAQNLIQTMNVIAETEVATEEIVQQRQEVRQSLLETVAATNQSETLVTQQSLLQKVLLTQSITQSPTELNNQTQNIAATLVVQFTKQVGGKFDSQTVQGIGSIISNVVSAATTKTELSTTEQATVTSLYASVGTLLSALQDNKVAGEKPTTIQTPQRSLVAYRNYGSALANYQLNTTASNSSSAIAVTLPSSFATVNASASPFNTTDEIFVSASSFAKNPYVSSSSANISTPIFSLTFEKASDTGRTAAPLSNLAVPFIFDIPVQAGAFKLNQVAKNASYAGNTAQCQYWDEKKLKWSTEGCTVRAYTATSITCACTHTTDFAGFWNYVNPNLNILTIQDIENITKLNKDNMLTVYVVSALAGAYLLVVAALFVWYLIARAWKKITAAPHKDQKGGRLRRLLREFRHKHLYMSFFFAAGSGSNRIPQFVRIERVTIIYITLLGMFCSNAISFNSNQKNEVQFIASGVISSLITTPFVFFLVFMLDKTKDKMTVQTTTEPTDVEIDSTTGEEVPVRRVTILTRVTDLLNHMIDKIDNFVDRAVTYVQKSLMGWSIPGVIIVTSVTIGYFGALVGALIALPFTFDFIVDVDVWIVGGLGVTVFIAFLWYLFFYVRVEKYRDGTLPNWRMSVIRLVLMFGFVALLFAATAAIAVAENVFLEKGSDWFNRLLVINCFLAAHTLAHLGIAISLCIEPKRKNKYTEEEPTYLTPVDVEKQIDDPYWVEKVVDDRVVNIEYAEEVIIKHKQVKKSKMSVLMAKLKEHLKQEKWFPWWFVFVDYLLIAIFVGLTSFVLILYGIKFSTEGGSKAQDMQWLMGSGISVGTDSVLKDPSMFFVKTVVYMALIQLMRGFLFPSRKPAAPPVTVPEVLQEEQENGKPRMGAPVQVDLIDCEEE